MNLQRSAYWFLALTLTALNSPGQTQSAYEWTVLANSPVQTGRYEDIGFANAHIGWAVSGKATIITTRDGGESWKEVNVPAPYNVYYRSLSLLNDSTAFIGALNSAYPLLLASHYGAAVSPVAVAGLKPLKICGLTRAGNSFFGVGGYDGAPTFIRSTDNGTTWTGTTMSPYAVSLVDVHFFNDSLGFTIGSADGSAFNNGKSVVLRTTNGGTSWETVYKSVRLKEWGWKIFFANDSVGYVSIERLSVNPGGVFYLKTVDRGKTWKDQYFLPEFDVEGIGFADESTGWIGGWTGPTYQTIDSGKSWKLFSLSLSMKNLNRIRRVNDTLMFAGGTQIFRYAPSLLTSVRPDQDHLPDLFTLRQNFPNPFNPSTTIQFTLARESTVRLYIYNSVGQMIEAVMDNPKPAGEYSLQWRPSPQLTSGVYFYQIRTEYGTVTRSMTYLK